MMALSFRSRAVALLAGAALPALTPVCAWAADSAAVKTLVDQGNYWQGRGRPDLARQAWRRALELDPQNAAAKRGLEGSGARQAAPTPTVVHTAAPVSSTPARAPAREPVREVAARPAAPAPRARPTVSADQAGRERVAAFTALQNGDYDTATRLFRGALARNRRDGDALGGLGLVALRQSRFSEARDYLEQAGRNGDAAKWNEALTSARFYAGMEEAQALLAKGQLDQARTAAEALVRSGYSQPGPALELLAEVYEKQGRYADAADLYRQAGEGGKVNESRLASRAAREQALAAAARGDDVGAEDAFRRGMALDHDDPWMRYEFARYMIARGRTPEAESLIASLSNSTDPDALYAAALLDSSLNRPGAAQALVERIPDTYRTAPMRSFAIGLKVDNAISRARTLGAQGHPSEALAALRQLGQATGVEPVKQAAIAEALADLGDNAGAANLAETALSGSMSDMSGYETLVRVGAKTGREDLARSALQKASDMAGTTPGGQQALASMNASLSVSQADRLRQSGQYAQAFDLLQGAWASAPDNADVLSALARLYQSGSMNARAAQTFQLVLARKPGDKDALSGLMETAQAAGDRNLSEQAQNEALSRFPQDYQVRLAAARTEQARGNARAATRYFKEARDLYTAQMSTAGGNPFAVPGANPFGSAAMGANPFRAQQQVMAPAPVNPFALGRGTRLPTQTYVPQPQAVAAQTYGATPPEPTATGVAAPGWRAPATPSSASPFAGSPIITASAGDGAAGSAYGAVQSYSSDPVLAGIERDIAALQQDTGPRAEVHTEYRSRSGETGLSKLREVKGVAELSTGLEGGRVYVRAEPTVIDSGRPTGSSLQRFGYNATIEAQSIVDAVAAQLVNADTQRNAGVALSAGFQNKLIQVEGGTTPVGFEHTKATWRAAITPQLAEGVQARAYFERQPVTDSIVAYSGTRDPVTGQFWGQVMKTGGGGGLSIDHNGSGVYADASYHHFEGYNVPTNHSVEANIGGYMRVMKTAHSTLTAGLNINYQTYGNDQNYFTYGHGGYFSPQSFLSLGVPINYQMQKDNLEIKANLTPGFQTYYESRVNLYPTDPAAQATLDALKAEDSDVRNYYDSLSQTGFALQAGAQVYYHITPNTRVGGEVSYNTFGSYDEFRSLLGIRQTLGGQK